MWFDFFLAVAFVCIILFLPGAIQCRALGFKLPTALAFAPVVSIFECALLGIGFQAIGIAISGWAIILCLALLSIACLVFQFANRLKTTISYISPINLCAYLAIGTIIAGLFYVRCLNGPDSFAQIYDNAFHLNLIQTFIDYGNFSVLSASLTPESSSGISFYPAAWHVVAAICGSCCNVPAAIAENAVNTVFLGLVFPSSACSFLSAIFERFPKTIFLGSVLPLAFGAFPWGFLTFGPLYSNFAAFCLLPVVLAFLVHFLRAEKSAEKLSCLLLFISGGFVLACSQPNAIYTGIILLSAYCVVWICNFARARFKKKYFSFLLPGLFILFVCVIWIVSWKAPFMAGTVNYQWESFATFSQAIKNIGLLSLRESPAQVALGLIVLIGLIQSILKKGYRWLAVTYLIACLMYLVNATSDGLLKSFLTGFWYNDPYRIAACVALAAMPLGFLGLHCIFQFGEKTLTKLFSEKKLPAFFYSIVFLALAFTCFYSTDPLNILKEETSFEKTAARLEWLSDPATRKLTIDEEEFIEDAKTKIQDEPGVILNFPYDGSAFAYGACDLNIYYKNFGYTSSDKNSDNYIVQHYLCEISDLDTVKNAARQINAKYLLLLDAYYPNEGTLNEDIYLMVGGGDSWSGITSISDDTPGFELLLSRNDMRLYKISS